ncbi:GntR family transcriptional regulator [Nocardiopsis alba]|uniref:GntR family transcriptional regulator n=1 Tax=Nocardiopsis alba TaxID=53437 RepID=UPI0036729B61
MTEDPLYVRLADELRARIAEGEWVGETLPPERVLAEERQVSRNTVIKAYDLLVHEGLVTPGRGRAGRKVRDRRVLTVFASQSERLDRMTTSSVDTWVSDVQEDGREPGQTIGVGVVSANKDLAAWLGVERDVPVAVRRRLRTIDGHPDNIADTFYPPVVTEVCPEIMNPADVPQGVLTLMADRGFPQVRCEDRLRWGPATPEEASQLKLAPGVSVLRQNRIGYGPEDLPIRVAITVWPGDTHELRYEMSS